MDNNGVMRRQCEAYVKKMMAVQRFDLKDFVAFMEPVFAQFGYREQPENSASKFNRKWKSILVVRLDSVSDVILTGGFLRELRRNLPQAHITLVVNPLAEPLMSKCPYINELRVFYTDGATALLDAIAFCQQYLWQRRYDLCLCPRWDIDESQALLVGYLSGAKERIGYSETVHPAKAEQNRGFDNLLTVAVTEPPGCIHEAARNFYLLTRLGLTISSDEPEIWLTGRDENKALRLLRNFRGERALATVALGANEPGQKYPVEKFVAALRPLADANLAFVLLGSSNFSLEGYYFHRHMPQGSVLNLIGCNSRRVDAAIVGESSLYIGNNTSLAHIAAALKVPVVEVVAEAEETAHDPRTYSVYERYYPWKVPAIVLRPRRALSPCDQVPAVGGCSAPKPHCITQISPEELRQAVISLAAYLGEQATTGG